MNFSSLIKFAILFAIIGITSASAKQKIGIYDSRLVAVAYANSEQFQAETKTAMEAYQKAIESKDSLSMKKIESERALMQRIFHDKGFGKGSVAEYLENKEDIFRALATKFDLISIVSKWELNYHSDDIELIDITIDLLKELKANEKVLKMYETMKSNPPVKNAFFLDVNQ
jgi:hypothetical protein